MYTSIESQDDLDTFLELTGHFHDSLLREVSMLKRGFVDTDCSMHGDVAPTDARLIFHFQDANIGCVEMIFENLMHFDYEPSFCCEGWEGKVTDTSVYFFFSSPNFIHSEKVMYKIHGNKHVGENLLISKHIPYGEIIESIHIQDDWYQCTSCFDAWEVHDTFCAAAKCPTCGLFCEIKRPEK